MTATIKIHEERKGKASIFYLVGRLDSSTSPEVEKKIDEQLSQDILHIILDLTKLDYISSAGLRILVHCHKVLEKRGGRILLAGVQKPIENILYVTGFLPYFKLYDSTDQALATLET